MHLHVFLLVVFLLQQCLVVPAAYASDGETLSGSTILLDGSGSISPINNQNASSGSVLPIDENSDQQNSSSSNSDITVTIPLRQSPLLVRINEVAWMGSDVSTADEWLELTAIPSLTGAVLTQPLNLKGWNVSIQKDTGESVIATFTQDLFIGSGQYLIVANNAASSSRLKNDPILISSAISLPNTKLLLRLRDADSTLVDEVDDLSEHLLQG